jgi:PAS domain S-box-containing protein
MIARMHPRRRWWRDGSVLLVLGPLGLTLIGCVAAAYETDRSMWLRLSAAIVLVASAAVALGAWLLWRAERRHAARLAVETRRRVAELHAIGDLVDVLLWCTSANGSVTYLSRRWVDYTGMPTAEMLADTNWLEAIHSADRDETERRFRNSLALGRPYDVQHRIRGADGAYRWFRTSGLPLRDSQDRIISWFGCSSDIEGRRGRSATFDMLAAADSNGRAMPPIPVQPLLPQVEEFAFDVARRSEPGADDDWCDVFVLPDGRVFVTLGRTSGVAESTGADMVRDARRLLWEIAIEEKRPGAVLDRLNVAMLMRRSGSFASVCGYVDRATRVLEYATAGTDGVFLGAEDGVRRLPGGGPPIGVYAGPAYTTHAIVLLDAQLIIINDEAAQHTPAERLSAAIETLDGGGAGAFSAAAIGDAVGAGGAFGGTVLTMRGRAGPLVASP